MLRIVFKKIIFLLFLYSLFLFSISDSFHSVIEKLYICEEFFTVHAPRDTPYLIQMTRTAAANQTSFKAVKKTS